MSVLPDDTLSDLKKRVVASSGVSARNASEIYAWRALGMDVQTSVAYIVNAAMESGGSDLIGPRIVTLGHLNEARQSLTGVRTAKKVNQGAFLTGREATAVIHAQANLDVTVPLGVVHKVAVTGVPLIMMANPFLAEIAVDPLMASPTGDLRDVYQTTAEDDVLTLETLFRSRDSTIVLDMTCVADVSSHVMSQKQTVPEDAWRAGFLRRYFPMQDAWRRGALKSAEEAKAEASTFAATRRAIKEVLETQSSSSRVERCVLTSILLEFGQTEAQSKIALDQSSGFDVLTRIFERFRVSRDVPVVRYHDGRSASYKVARIALTSKRAQVSDYLARCTRLAMGMTTPSRAAQKKPSVHFLVSVGQNDVATVHLRQDLSYALIRNFSASSAGGGGAFDDVTSAHASVNKRVMQQVWTIVTSGSKLRGSSSSRSSVLIHQALHGWADIDRLPGSSQLIGTVFTIALPEGTVPRMAHIGDVVERMFPFFVPVTTPGPGDVLFLQYRRVDRFEHTDGLLQTLRLLRDEPIAVITEKVARAFGLSEEEASRRIEAELKNGKVPYIPTLFRSGVFITLTHGARGIQCRVSGCTSAAQHRRIVRLLLLAVDVAGPASPFLGWVVDPERYARIDVKRRRTRYLEDWEDEGDDDQEEEQDVREEQVTGDAEIDAILAAERGTYEAEEEQRLIGPVTHESVLREIVRSDPALFLFRGKPTRYSTLCGKVNGRQPTVVTKEELAGLAEGSHTGAIAYGTTPVTAARNRYICPDVWCPRSRTSMSLAQFVEADRKCPLEDETPVVSDNPYFNGKSRHPGFLNPSQHPDGVCMPCCFRRPRQRFSACSGPSHPGVFLDLEREDDTEDGKELEVQNGKDKEEDDPRYLRNQRAPLDDGRYGLLPTGMVDLLGGRQRCGGREDGSGQMSLHTQCFVRRGTPRHSQSFMSCMIWMLDNPDCRDIKSFVALVERRLTPDVFVTLNDGRLSQVLMREVISEGVRERREDTSRFLSWIVSDAATSYVTASDLGDVREEAQGQLVSKSQSKSKSKSTSDQDDQLSLEFRRESLLFSAMRRFIGVLRDASMLKRHPHLLDLCSRPLDWLNPHHSNVLMFEVQQGEEDAIFFTCPYDGGRLERHIRLSDPFVLLLCKGEAYHPIVRVHMSRRDGVQEQRSFHYDSDRFLHQAIFRLLQGCGADDLDELGMLMTGLVTLGERPGWQVLDYKLRLVGIMTASRVYITLSSGTTPLVGLAASKMGTLYVDDAMRIQVRPRGDLFVRLREATGITFSSPSAAEGSLLLGHLGVFVGQPREDTRLVEQHRSLADRACRDRLIRQFRDALWSNASAASELVFLRHGFNPLPQAVRRRLTSELVHAVLLKGGSQSSRSDPRCVPGPAFVDHILFSPDPLTHSHVPAPAVSGALTLTDIDLMSSSLDHLLSRGVPSLDGATSAIEPVPVLGSYTQRDGSRRGKSTSRTGSGSLISMHKSLFHSVRRTSVSSSAAGALPVGSVPSAVTGARMIRCHPWRALSLAQQLVHTELILPAATPLMVMENMMRDKKTQGGVSPGDVRYQPGEEDVRQIARAFDLSVMLIRDGKIAFDSGGDTDVLLLAWIQSSWYVVLSDSRRLLWERDTAHKIHSRLH